MGLSDTLILLLSDQHVPNLLSVHHFKPSRLVLVETDQMKLKKAAGNLLHALALGGLPDYERTSEILHLASEDSPNAIEDLLDRRLRSRERYIVNLTGGTKPMSIGAWSAGLRHGADLVYSNVASPGQIRFFRSRDQSGQRVEEVKHRPTIEEFIAGYGFKVTSTREDLEAKRERARKWWAISCKVARANEGVDLLNLSSAERETGRRKGLDLRDCHLAESLRAGGLDRCVAQAVLGRDAVVGKVREHEFDFLTGGWLEAFFFGLIERCKGSEAVEAWDVTTGAQVESPSGARNELDVVFIRRYELTMIECKSGAQEERPESFAGGEDATAKKPKQARSLIGDSLNKIEAIMTSLRALRVRKILATNAPGLYEQGLPLRIKDHLRKRAGAYDLRLVARHDIQNLARLATEAPDSLPAALASALEKGTSA